MSNLIELTAKIVASHASKTVMTTEQLLQDLHHIHAALQLVDQGVSPEPLSEEPTPPTLTTKQSFKKNEVICMICNKGGFKTLTKHLIVAHNLKPGQYRKQFNIPSTQKLAAKSYSEERSKAAIDRGMVDILAKAREKRMANIEAKNGVVAVRVKAPVPAVRKKAAAPAVRVKASAPEKVKGQKVK